MWGFVTTWQIFISKIPRTMKSLMILMSESLSACVIRGFNQMRNCLTRRMRTIPPVETIILIRERGCLLGLDPLGLELVGDWVWGELGAMGSGEVSLETGLD